MTGKPRCSKCGRVLKDPVSIAIGLGPECRGDSGGRGKKVSIRQRRRQARAYRTLAFKEGQPVTIGVGETARTYRREGDSWVDQNGHRMSSTEFAGYLRRFGLVDPECVDADHPYTQNSTTTKICQNFRTWLGRRCDE